MSRTILPSIDSTSLPLGTLRRADNRLAAGGIAPVFRDTPADTPEHLLSAGLSACGISL